MYKQFSFFTNKMRLMVTKEQTNNNKNLRLLSLRTVVDYGMTVYKCGKVITELYQQI